MVIWHTCTCVHKSTCIQQCRTMKLISRTIKKKDNSLHAKYNTYKGHFVLLVPLALYMYEL